jgi:hypothetical protein
MTETIKEAARRLAAPMLAKGFKPEGLYQYTTPDGTMTHARMRLKNPETGDKYIRPLYLNGTEWEMREPDYPDGKPLYRLHALAAQPEAPCWFVEGENCANPLAKLGLLATTAGSASSDEGADFAPLAGRTMTIWPDNDAAGIEHGKRVAAKLLELGCAVESIDAVALGLPEGGDCVDWLNANPGATATDLAKLPRASAQAIPLEAVDGKDGAEIVRLARLPPIEYDRERQAAAERLGIRAATLDAEVRKQRGDAPDDSAGEALIFPKRAQWPEKVDGAELLNELARTFCKFIVLPKHADDALALWIAFTYFADVASVAPILAAVSPEKRCGKTSLLGLLSRLAHRPLAASSISPAALFRAVEKWSPTLLIDEADAFLRDNEELRGILNSGHTRETAFVIRAVGVGDDFEPRRFSTWGPKAIALIGTLPDTLTDRSIVVELRRKHASERVEKLRRAGDLEPIERRCLRFANDHREAIRAARPGIPEELHDRAGDNWEPLLAIADAAGGDWPVKARKAASVLSGLTPDGDSVKVELLTDIRRLLTGRLLDCASVGSGELVNLLTEDKTGRWAEFSRGKALTQRQLARLLRPFGITPGTVRLDTETAKGYSVEAFADAFARYTPTFDPSHRHKPLSMRVVTDKASVTETDLLRIADPSQATPSIGCDGVTDENPPLDARERF